MFTDLQKRETLIGCLPHTPWRGIEPTTQACAHTGDRTRSLLVYGMMLQPSEPPGQGVTGFNLNAGSSQISCCSLQSLYLCSLIF